MDDKEFDKLINNSSKWFVFVVGLIILFVGLVFSFGIYCSISQAIKSYFGG